MAKLICLMTFSALVGAFIGVLAMDDYDGWTVFLLIIIAAVCLVSFGAWIFHG